MTKWGWDDFGETKYIEDSDGLGRSQVGRLLSCLGEKDDAWLTLGGKTLIQTPSLARS